MAIDLRTVPTTDVFESPFNTRTHFDAEKMRDLEASIREVGVLTPLIVRPVGERYELAAGHRRLRAARAAGVEAVPVSIRPLTDLQLREVITIENLQREDIHPLDEARGYQGLLKAGKGKAYTVSDVAAKVGKSESYVYRRLKLLELEPELQTALSEDRLSLAHAEKLMRLTPALRKEAADPEKGVVWFVSPLLSRLDNTDEPMVPTAEDLRPLHDLEVFIRTRHHFDPASRDTRHLQPELAVQLDAMAGAIAKDAEDFDDNVDAAQSAAVASLVHLTLDPMARMRLRAEKTDTIPLTPSKWREVKGDKDRCPHVRRGVITHGGEARILDVCTTRTCQKHFPVAKKKTAKKSAAPPQRNHWEEEQRRQREEEKAWSAMRPLIQRAYAEHVATAELRLLDILRKTSSPQELKRIRDSYGVALTAETALQVVVLGETVEWSFDSFSASTRTWGFDAKAWRKRYEKQQAEKGTAELAAQREQLAGTSAGQAPAKAGAKKGGRK